jgi:hypothetical protein
MVFCMYFLRACCITCRYKHTCNSRKHTLRMIQQLATTSGLAVTRYHNWYCTASCGANWTALTLQAGLCKNGFGHSSADS